MTDAAQRLRHDVAKYITRAARNLGQAPISAALADLLIKDLYEAPGGGRPSARFAALASAIDPATAARVTAMFTQLDTLEAAVRKKEEQAMRSAAALALALADAILRATS